MQYDRFIPTPLDEKTRDIANFKLLTDLPPMDKLPFREGEDKENLSNACFGCHYDDIAKTPILRFGPPHPQLNLKENPTLLEKKKSFVPHYISSSPERSLDAPRLVDDFYLNVLDWSPSNKVAIALSNQVYIWDGDTSVTTGPVTYPGHRVTSVKFFGNEEQLLVGLSNGDIQLLQIAPNLQLITNFPGHGSRVATIDWIAGERFATGDMNGDVRIYDRRTPFAAMQLTTPHMSEVCKVITSPFNCNYLATGGNDNLLCLLDINNPGAGPIRQWNHLSGVKAVDFNPLNRRWMASGGGTGDRSIRVFDINSGKVFQKIDTGSQISNLFWSRCPSDPTVVTTHGYGGNCVKVWHQNTNGSFFENPITTLQGHERRIPFAAIHGAQIATACADETLNFNIVFNPNGTSRKKFVTEKKRKFLEMPKIR